MARASSNHQHFLACILWHVYYGMGMVVTHQRCTTIYNHRTVPLFMNYMVMMRTKLLKSQMKLNEKNLLKISPCNKMNEQ